MGLELVLDLPSESDTLALGNRLGQGLMPGTKIYLMGELGAGKTTLVRGMLRALMYAGPVKSPTYTLVELYSLSRLDLHHFDFYRFDDSDEWDDAGFREVFATDSVCVVEWPERARRKLPEPDLEVTLHYGTQGRRARLSAHTATGELLLAKLNPPTA